MLLPTTVTVRPRFVYTAFPLLISLVAWWGDDSMRKAPIIGRCFRGEQDDWWSLLIGVCCAGIVSLTGLYGAGAAIP
jgi:hypothetical protein